MRKAGILYIIFILSIMFYCGSDAFAVSAIPQKDANINITVEADDEDFEETDIIKKVSFRDKFKRSPEAQIQSFFKKYNRYSSKNNIEKLKELYSEDYINNDGFNKETIFKMMEMASGAYKDVSYITEIESIKVEGNYAVVKAYEIAKGETIKVIEKLQDTGSILSEIYYTDYLKKEGNKWKIVATEINSEKVDYAILKRPIYFYMYDIVEYATDLRGFYMDIHKELPGKIYKEENEMLMDIKNQIYDDSRMEVFNQRFNNLDDGKASKRVVDIIYKAGH